MNTIYIHDNLIELIGFEGLHNKAYITFRNGGVAISGEKMGVENEELEFVIKEREISDHRLEEKLIQRGFLESHSFIQTKDGTYFCEYPKKEKER